MELSIDHIENEMRGGNLVPAQITDFRTYLAALISYNAANLDKVLDQKPAIWLAIREHKKSDTVTEREWDNTELGRLERHLRTLMKRADVLNRALASKLRMAELEMRNQM